MGQILSIIVRCLWGEKDDQEKSNEKLPLISPASSRPALQPNPRREYTLQANLRTNHPPPPLSSNSSSSSFTHSKTSGASRFEPTLETHHQRNLSSYGLSSKIASSPPKHDTHQQLSSTSSSTTQIHPKLVQTHQPLGSNSFGVSGTNDTSHAQPKIQAHPSLLSGSGRRWGGVGVASHVQPVIVTPKYLPSSNLGINPRSDDDALDLLINPAKSKIQVVGDEKQVCARLQRYDRLEETEEERKNHACSGVVGRNWRDYRSSKEKVHQEEGKGKISIGVRRINHYRSDYRILLVGEGDFSFSASLALAFASATNITATSLDSIEFLSRNYSRALSNINRLQRLGALVMHDVDATKMANVFPFKYMLLHRVIYNFPLAGFFPDEEREDQICRNQRLIQLFLENAKKMINIDGEIHITHKCNDGFFQEWNLELLASRNGLRLIEEVPFNFRDYPGYRTKYGFGGDNNFNCNPSKTYKFGHKNQF